MKMKAYITWLMFVCLGALCGAEPSTPEYRLFSSLSNIADVQNEVPLDELHLNSARGEAEHFQMVVSLPVSEAFVFVEKSNKNGFDVRCRKIEKAGRWDDVLVPARRAVRADSDGTVKLWFTYQVPRELLPGEYEEEIRIICGETEVKIPVPITVNKLTLPITPSLPAVVGVVAEMFEKTLKLEEERRSDAMREWAEFLLEYRVSPYFAEWRTRQDHEAYSSPWPMDDPRTYRLLSDPRFSKVALPFYALDDVQLDSMIATAKHHGFYEKSYFYLSDEPSTLSDYENLAQFASRLHCVDPSAEILTTFYCGPKDGPDKDDLFSVFDIWKGHTKIFCMSAWALQRDESAAKKCRELLRSDQEWWTYVCMGPDGREPNWLLEMPGMQHRAVMWRAWKEQSSGFLYWAANSFVLEGDRHDIIGFREGLPEGDGLLVYPGEFYGADGPLASIRLERLRDSLEDYEYLKAVELFAGRNAADETLEKIYRNPVDYTSIPDDVEDFRNHLLELLFK